MFLDGLRPLKSDQWSCELGGQKVGFLTHWRALLQAMFEGSITDRFRDHLRDRRIVDGAGQRNTTGKNG